MFQPNILCRWPAWLSFVVLVLGCSDTPCPSGKRQGTCGLKGICVECTADADCPPGKRCASDGSCYAEIPCQDDGACKPGQKCGASSRCELSCGADWQCPPGERCVEGICALAACDSAGRCPDGWEVAAGTIGCNPSFQCPPGQRPGACGLRGQCVECMRDEECGSGMLCAEDGRCVNKIDCSEASCDPYYECIDGRCLMNCSWAGDCPAGLLCKNHGCIGEECQADGYCPEGWKPKGGSNRCEVEDCEVLGYLNGACGMNGKCINCYTNDDCDPSMSCSPEGMCAYDSDLQCHNDSDCGYSALCIGIKCVISCAAQIDCPWSNECVNNRCLRYRCSKEERKCPADWSSYPGTLLCVYDPCHDQWGKTGLCGLSGRCVECNVDLDCQQGQICSLTGSCVAQECFQDADCGLLSFCREHRCVSPCVTDDECGESGRCEGSPGFCYPVRCNQFGFCSRWGWRATPGTLACHYEGCYWMDGWRAGVCGRAEECVQCIDDSDCVIYQYCSSAGYCEDECSPWVENSCPAGETCVDYHCNQDCATDNDCLGGKGICGPNGTCFYERCTKEGTCPTGWIPGDHTTADGTLWCIRAP